MKKFTKPLQKFGLSENEIKIYLEILKQEELSPFQISKLTKIPRTTVYDVLMDLSLKGLIELEQSDGFTKQQTKVRAKNPSILRKILQKKRDDSVKLEAEILDILPNLKEMFHKEEANADFKFYPGIEGVRQVYLNIENDSLDIQEHIFTQLMPSDVFGSPDINTDIEKNNTRRKEQKVIAHELLPLNDWTKHVLTYQYQRNKNYLANREFRYIQSPFLEMFLDIVIKGDYIKIACAEGEEVWGLSIKSSALAKSLTSIHKFMWHIATPITQQMLESWGENKFLTAQKAIKKHV